MERNRLSPQTCKKSRWKQLLLSAANLIGIFSGGGGGGGAELLLLPPPQGLYRHQENWKQKPHNWFLSLSYHRFLCSRTRASSRFNSISTPPCREVMKYAIPCWLAMVILKYQGKPATLFTKYPIPTWSFLLSTCVYWLIAGKMKGIPIQGTKFFPLLTPIALAAATLSPLSLLSTLLPLKLSFLPFIIWTLVLVALAKPLFSCIYTHICKIITSVALKFWPSRCNMTQPTSLPV